MSSFPTPVRLAKYWTYPTHWRSIADRSEEFSRVEYSMINYKDYYEISPESSEIRFLKSLALYPHSTMNLTIRATDNPKGKPSARNIAYGTVRFHTVRPNDRHPYHIKVLTIPYCLWQHGVCGLVRYGVR